MEATQPLLDIIQEERPNTKEAVPCLAVCNRTGGEQWYVAHRAERPDGYQLAFERKTDVPEGTKLSVVH